MTGSATRWRTMTAALTLAAAAAAAPAPAQDSTPNFDLRPRATPTPQPPVVGPVDPENPTPQVRPPRAAPPAEAPPATPATPTVVDTPAATAEPPPERPASPAAADPGVATRAATPTPTAPDRPSPTVSSVAETAGTGVGETDARAGPVGIPAAAPYAPRQLPVTEPGGFGLLWLLLAGLAGLAALAGGLVWSRHVRHRPKALPAPAIERPRLPAASAIPASPAAPTAPAAPVPPPESEVPALAIALQATRLSASLIATTLSYRLAVTNNGAAPLSDVTIAGDMIAAHASRPTEELLGPAGATLPELHRVASLAPGESVTLGGDIRLPLVAITPIRRGNAAFFVPLARLRARGLGPDGAPVEGGGTFLVGQEAARPADPRLKPFRLDLGPRNYSQLGQQLLPAHA